MFATDRQSTSTRATVRTRSFTNDRIRLLQMRSTNVYVERDERSRSGGASGG